MAGSKRPPNLWPVIGAAMVLTLLVTVAYTFLFARKVTGLAFGAGLLWLLLLVIICTGLALTASLRPGDKVRPGQTGIFVKWAAIPVSILAAMLSLFWLALAYKLGPESLLGRLHWLVQIMLLAGALFLIGRRYVIYQDRPSPEAQMKAKENARRRERLIADLGEIHGSVWLAGFEPGSTGARLRAAIAWWQEEIAQGLPARGPALGEEAVGLYLDDLNRHVNTLEDLMSRSETNAGRLLEAERSVIEAINRTGRLARQLMG